MLEAGARISASNPAADILDVAARCFQERGYQATSIDEVARGVGATKGRIYYHFRSKPDLFAAVFRAGMEMLAEKVRPVAELDLPAAEKLRRMAQVHVVELIRTQPYQRVVWQGVNMHLRGATTPDQREAFDELVRTRNAYGELFRAAMEAARQEGTFAFDNPSVVLQVFLVSLNSPIIWYSPRPGETEADIDRLASQVVEFAMSGLNQKEAA
ncbi:TetR/AcrR family transcriptional regulator [Oricola sp.]|uniref:TetR/AcrR family transcriptional regulator n=1 Tax=Oricola sp. TaxID=1979950 RepID=UPI003BA9E4BA